MTITKAQADRIETAIDGLRDDLRTYAESAARHSADIAWIKRIGGFVAAAFTTAIGVMWKGSH